jgi:hypothetical protein
MFSSISTSLLITFTRIFFHVAEGRGERKENNEPEVELSININNKLPDGKRT